MDAVLRIRESGNLDYIQIIKKPGGSLSDSFLADGFCRLSYATSMEAIEEGMKRLANFVKELN